MTTAILETTARPIALKGSKPKPRHSRNNRNSNRSDNSGLKSGFTLSATELGDGAVKVFFGQVGLTVTPRNEAAVEALLEGTLAGGRIDAMFAALTAA